MVDVWAPVAEVIGTEQFNEEKLNNLLKQQKIGWRKRTCLLFRERAIGHIDPEQHLVHYYLKN